MSPLIPLPPGRSLLPYQEKAIPFMLGARGTLLGDEMGLGKTPTSIAFLNALARHPHPGHRSYSFLIVAPAGLRINWANELRDWYVGNDGERFPLTADLVRVASYHEAQGIAESERKWDCLVVDEAHYVKNAHTVRSQTVKRLSDCSSRVILITGTPYENSPVELWPLLQIVAPDAWDPRITRDLGVTPEQRKSHPGEGWNFWEFARKYCDLKKKRIQTVSPRTGRTFYKTALDFSGSSNLPALQRKLRETCMVRRLKGDVLSELPPKRRQVIVLRPEGTEGQVIGLRDEGLLGDLNFENYEEKIKGLTAEKVLFTEWSKKRHAQGLALITPVLEVLEETWVQDREGKRILFCHHQDVAEKYHAALTALGLNPVLATGQTHPADRGAAVKRFQEDADCKVFVGSIKAAGVGITLTAACGVDFAEQSPVPGEMSQAEDRAHRVGSEKREAGKRGFVHVRIFVSDGSLSARMMKIVVRKQESIREGLDTMAKEEPRRAESNE